MTDTTTFYRNLTAQVGKFVGSLQELRLMRDRIGADSFLSGQAATAAQTTGRADLSAADFDNFKVCMDLLDALLNSTAGQAVTDNVNTGGKAVLALYKLM